MRYVEVRIWTNGEIDLGNIDGMFRTAHRCQITTAENDREVVSPSSPVTHGHITVGLSEKLKAAQKRFPGALVFEQVKGASNQNIARINIIATAAKAGIAMKDLKDRKLTFPAESLECFLRRSLGKQGNANGAKE